MEEINKDEIKAIIIACEMAKEELKLRWNDLWQYTTLTKEGRKTYKKGEIVYDNLIAKLRKDNKIRGKIYLDTTLNKIKK